METMSVEWSELPPELIEIIAGKLRIYIDYLRFRAVCKNFRSSVSKTPRNLPRQLPWLLLPRGHHHHNRAFFSLSDDKFHLLNLPEPSNRKRRCGSSHGWLAFVDESPSFFLLNAVTNVKFHLPPLTTFPMVVDFDYAKVGREYTLRLSNGELYSRSLAQMRDSLVKKLVLSSCPSKDDGFIAMVILGGDLAFCRKGDESWSVVDGASDYLEDVVYRDDRFYAVNCNGGIAMIDFRPRSPEFTLFHTPWQTGGDVHYLVHCGEDLMFVSRYLDLDYDVESDQSDILTRTMRFKVTRLNWSKGRFEGVTCLGDHAFFVGENSSLCVAASEFPGCKANCIYFTDDYSISDYDGVWGDYDLGVFNLGDGRIEAMSAYPRNSRSVLQWPPPIWVTPNPC